MIRWGVPEYGGGLIHLFFSPNPFLKTTRLWYYAIPHRVYSWIGYIICLYINSLHLSWWLLKGLCNDFSTCHISVVFCCLNNTLQSSEFFLLVNCHKRWFWSVFCTAQNSFPRLNGEISSMRAANKSRQNRDVVGRTRKKGDCCTVPATCYWTTNHSANSRSRVSRYE